MVHAHAVPANIRSLCVLGFQGLEEGSSVKAVCGQMEGSPPKPTEVHLLQQRCPEAGTAGCADGLAFLYQPVAGALSHQDLTPQQVCACCQPCSHVQGREPSVQH